MTLQRKVRTEVFQLEDTLAQVRKEYEMLRIEFEQTLAANEQAGTSPSMSVENNSWIGLKYSKFFTKMYWCAVALLYQLPDFTWIRGLSLFSGPINREMRHLISTLQTHNQQLKGEVVKYKLRLRETQAELHQVGHQFFIYLKSKEEPINPTCRHLLCLFHFFF